MLTKKSWRVMSNIVTHKEVEIGYSIFRLDIIKDPNQTPIALLL
jgi:hypothetical protein